MSGFLIGGAIVAAPGLTVFTERDFAWCKLDAGDFKPRAHSVNKVCMHTTKGIAKQIIRPGAGPGVQGRSVLDFWRGDPQHSAAQIVIDRDGVVYCAADLKTVCAYHATTVNEYAVGIEMYQDADGGIYEATLDAGVATCKFLASLDAFGFAYQTTSRTYVENTVIERLKWDGGPDVVGIFGHRDNAWTFPAWLSDAQRKSYPLGFASRGRGDPGDEFYRRLIASGCEAFDIDARAELTTWKRRQAKMVARGAKISVDGIAMRNTMTAMASLGYSSGASIDA